MSDIDLPEQIEIRPFHADGVEHERLASLALANPCCGGLPGVGWSPSVMQKSRAESSATRFACRAVSVRSRLRSLAGSPPPSASLLLATSVGGTNSWQLKRTDGLNRGTEESLTLRPVGLRAITHQVGVVRPQTFIYLVDSRVTRNDLSKVSRLAGRVSGDLVLRWRPPSPSYPTRQSAGRTGSVVQG